MQDKKFKEYEILGGSIVLDLTSVCFVSPLVELSGSDLEDNLFILQIGTTGGTLELKMDWTKEDKELKRKALDNLHNQIKKDLL